MSPMGPDSKRPVGVAVDSQGRSPTSILEIAPHPNQLAVHMMSVILSYHQNLLHNVQRTRRPRAAH